MTPENESLVREVAGYDATFYANDDPLYAALIEWAREQTAKS